MSTRVDIDPEWRSVAEVVAHALCVLADRAEAAVPATGGFDPLDESFAVEQARWTQGRVILRIAASPELTPTGTVPGDGRYLQVRVATPSGGSETSQILVSGGLAEVLALARTAGKAAHVVTVVRDLAETQRRLELEEDRRDAATGSPPRLERPLSKTRSIESSPPRGRLTNAVVAAAGAAGRLARGLSR